MINLRYFILLPSFIVAFFCVTWCAAPIAADDSPTDTNKKQNKPDDELPDDDLDDFSLEGLGAKPDLTSAKEIGGSAVGEQLTHPDTNEPLYIQVTDQDGNVKYVLAREGKKVDHGELQEIEQIEKVEEVILVHDENDLSKLLGFTTILVLAIFIGFEIITKVPPTLHTPLMSGSNAISGVTLIGAILAGGSGNQDLSIVLAVLAVLLATVNVVGGFLVTHRMLQMFRKRN